MRFGILCIILVVAAGCGSGRTRPRDEIFAEQQNLPGLFLTTKTHTRVIAPKNKGNFIDPETKEECWAALECLNADCPGRKGEEPFLFTTSDVKVHGGCPQCAKIRNFKTEKPADILKSFRRYELPEVKARAKALEDEIKRSFDAQTKAR